MGERSWELAVMACFFAALLVWALATSGEPEWDDEEWEGGE
ncbi:hypothetical protein [Paludisphaera mucosa]|uniref:Uncharacterized protein n=1 Tax=Paludisphaera mucosa TaxID=3030827 RepID=A0ABT6F6Q9_9BACT|nr:hypothetical protein [Paludisphaera mucosa]MDG3003267.1 hypothetical protein [Paludisphaera mucosa]